MRVFNELTTKLKAFYMHICTHLRMSKNGKNVMSSAESPDHRLEESVGKNTKPVMASSTESLR